MTPQEFKAWFDGFTEAFEGRVPSKAQWNRVKDRVAEIDGKPVTERIYVDRYWPSVIPYNGYWTRPHYGLCGNATTSTTNGVLATTSTVTLENAGYASSFNSLEAMSDLGRAEAASMGAA